MHATCALQSSFNRCDWLGRFKLPFLPRTREMLLAALSSVHLFHNSIRTFLQMQPRGHHFSQDGQSKYSQNPPNACSNHLACTRQIPPTNYWDSQSPMPPTTSGWGQPKDACMSNCRKRKAGGEPSLVQRPCDTWNAKLDHSQTLISAVIVH